MVKIKILYVISSLKSGGPDNVMLDIIKNIDHDKFDISVLALSEYNGRTIRDELEINKVNIYMLGLSRFSILFLGVQYISKIINEINPDIIHTHCIRSTYFISLVKTNARKVVTIHNYPHLDYAYTYGRIIGYIASRVYLHSLRNYDARIACSKSISDEIKYKFNIDTMFIRNGVEFCVYEYNKQELRQKLNLPIDKRIIIDVGNISDLKNQMWLVNFFYQQKYKDIAIVFLGDGDRLKDCLKYKNDNILFLGNVNNVREFLLAADLYVSASYTEGLPLSVCEALGAGLPVLLSHISPHEEIVSVNQAIGELYYIDDYEDFSDKLNLLLNINKTNGISKLVREVYEHNFSSYIMGKEYQKIYEKLYL